MSILDQLNQIAALAERGEEVMEMAIATGQQAAREGDANRAAIGALADVLCRRYEEGTLDTFAKNIGMKPRTVRSYRAVVRYYSFAHVCNLLEQGAPWSILRETAQAYPDDPTAADAFLETALDRHMTVEEAERALAVESGQPRKPTLADAVTEDLKRLREACEGVPELLRSAARLAEDAGWPANEDVQAFYAKAEAIRDALNPRVVADAAHGGGDAGRDAGVGA